ncbi:MAG TPA: VWA domain-containing protein [Lentimicrobium sp.]|jgi:Mg-chelatase subunit ChlD|nr:VWA domain-containing protein [Lentimicrobium sp.]
MAKDKVYNLIILDESGSMESIKNTTISGFNELVQTIQGIEKQYPEQKHFISFVTFNGFGIKTHLDKQSVSTLAPMDKNSYNPNSSTPLYDAIGMSVLKLKVDLGGMENTSVLVTILTDGEENASKEFNGSQIKKIIDEQKRAGWTFTYIGANQDVEQEAMKISITNTMKFEANDSDMHAMFSKEQAARHKFSEKIRSNQDRKEDFYK